MLGFERSPQLSVRQSLRSSSLLQQAMNACAVPALAPRGNRVMSLFHLCILYMPHKISSPCLPHRCFKNWASETACRAACSRPLPRQPSQWNDGPPVQCWNTRDPARSGVRVRGPHGAAPATAGLGRPGTWIRQQVVSHRRPAHFAYPVPGVFRGGLATRLGTVNSHPPSTLL